MASNVDRLHAAGVIDKSKLNKDQKNAINGLSEEECNSLIVISSKLKSEITDPDDHELTFVS